MLENIKASYFIELLFEHIYERRIFKIAKYNNCLKNKLRLNLINYYRFSGRYIQYETKDKNIGKEYDSFTDKILFEGEYKNGERNVNGKEYDKDGDLIFEGYWKNGKRWNVKGYISSSFIKNELKEGKGYLEEYFDQEYKYEGEYSNGERNGKGKEYYYNE